MVSEPDHSISQPTSIVFAVSANRGSNLRHLAVKLTERWNESVWGPVGRLVAAGVLERMEEQPRREYRRQVQRHHLTETGKANIVAQCVAGASVNGLSIDHNIDDKTASRLLRLAGVELRPTKQAIPDSELPATLKLREDGWSYDHLGQRYGRRWTAVRNFAVSRSAREKSTG